MLSKDTPSCRKRNKENAERKKTAPVTAPRRRNARPKGSLPKIAHLIKSKKKSSILDEESSIDTIPSKSLAKTNGSIPPGQKTEETSLNHTDVQIPTAKHRKPCVRKISTFMTRKRKVPITTQENKTEVHQIERYRKKSRPKSIQKIATLVRSKKKQSKAKQGKPEGSLRNKIAIVHPFENMQGENEKERSRADNPAVEVPGTPIEMRSQGKGSNKTNSTLEGAVNTAVYAAPLKKSNTKHGYENWNNANKSKSSNEYDNAANWKNKEVNETVMIENGELYNSSDSIANGIGHSSPGLYEDIKSVSKDNVDDALNESSGNISLPETYKNLPHSRTSLA